MRVSLMSEAIQKVSRNCLRGLHFATVVVVRVLTCDGIGKDYPAASVIAPFDFETT